MAGRVFVGISGWTYAGWRRVFYPEGLPHRRELEYVGERLATVEINGSFYSLQRPTSYLAWREATPPGFVFAVKGSRFITHMLKLRNAETALANFFASGVLTADFAYLRLHGARQLYASGYTDDELDWWAARIRAWREGGAPEDAVCVGRPARKRAGRDVYVYFDNDAKVHAPFDALRLAGRLATAPSG